MNDMFRKHSTAVVEPGVQVVASLSTDPGCHRANNQDFGAVVRAPMCGDSRGILLIVADGMGGHQGGEVASRLAVDIVTRLFVRATGEPHRSLEKGFEEANREIYRRSLENRELTGMGTTCTALALARGFAWAAHVGDSRLYLFRGGTVYQLTEDHSAVMQLVREGSISAAEARHHEDRNIILRALGTRKHVEVSLWAHPMPLKPGDCFLLCSDGLYEPVEDTELLDVAGSLEPAAACANLVALARERGGFDNITVAIARVSGGSATEGSLRETREVEGIQ
jgi:PPM family protein phosphatase